MTELIALINQKGGVAKSTTAHALGCGLMTRGKSVLFIDMDAQGNLTNTLCADETGLTTYDLLTKQATAAEAIQHLEQGDAIASSKLLSGVDAVLTMVGKEFRLKEALAPVLESYDYIIIDTPPALGILTVNALTACTGVIIPSQADVYSLQGISQLYTTIETVKQYCNQNLKVKGILLTRYSSRAILSRDIADILDQTAAKLETKLFSATIREAIAIKEAQANRTDIFSYAPKSNACMDYNAFIDEFLERG